MGRTKRWAVVALGALALESVGAHSPVRAARAEELDLPSEDAVAPEDESRAFDSENEVPVGTDAVYEPSGPVTFDTFYSSLSPYGEWIEYGGYGLVWRPYAAIVGDDFRPYATGGQWVYTQFGWSFASAFPWGWAPFHYGRWILDPSFGWIWVPGYAWGPAWVDWRYGGGFVGWAPLPPFGFGADVASFYPWWCFVGVSVFPSRHFHHHIVAHRDVPHVFRETRPVRELGTVHGHRVWRGPPRREIAQVTGVPVREVPIRRIADPQQFQRIAPAAPPRATVVPPPVEGRVVRPPSTAAPRTSPSTPAPSPVMPRARVVSPTPRAQTPAPTVVPRTTTPPPTVVTPPATRSPTTVSPPLRVPTTPAPTVRPPTTVTPRVVTPSTPPPVSRPPTTVAPRVVTPSTPPPVVRPPTTVTPRVVVPSTPPPVVRPPSTVTPRVVVPSPPPIRVPATPAPMARPPTTVAPPIRIPSTPPPAVRAPTVVAPPPAARPSMPAPMPAPRAAPMSAPHAAPGHVGGGGKR